MSSKQLLIDLEEYNKEKKDTFTEGFVQGRNQISQVVNSILKNKGTVNVDENAEPEIKAFIAMLKKAADLLPDGALDEQTDPETSGSDQVVPDEEPSEDSV